MTGAASRDDYGNGSSPPRAGGARPPPKRSGRKAAGRRRAYDSGAMTEVGARAATSAPTVRRARPQDAEAVVPLLYESAASTYDRFAGGRARALRILRRGYETDGTSASAEVVTVCELDGRPAGALVGFPVEETASRAARFLRLALRATPPWRWPRALWLYWTGARAVPSPPGEALYVDALATEPSARRRGVARALLADAEHQARERGLPAVALDTALVNRPARALYVSVGFEEIAYKPAGRGLPGFVALVKEL
jgi:ribosomal protein S18 acetylase RimI-like enzyme